MQPKPAPIFAFGPRNFRLMWIGLAVLALGFITMMFGDKENYGEDFLGITLGPIFLVIGFGIEFAAIMVRDKGVTIVETPVLPGTVTPATPMPPVPPAAPAYKKI